MIHPLVLILVVCGVIFILYLILTYEKDKRGLKNTEQTIWDDYMVHLYNEVVDEINRPVVDNGWSIQRDCTGKAVYGRVPVGSSIPVGVPTKASLLLRLFGKNFQSKSKADKEHWVKLYDKGSECTSNTEYVSNTECVSNTEYVGGSEVYISSKGFMVTVNNSENSSKDKPKFHFDLVKDGDDVNTSLLTVEEDFHKLSYIVSAILDGKFKPSSSPYDKYWLELERVKVSEVVSDHQKVVDFFDELDQRWYEYSVMYNDAMSGVVGFTPYASKLSVGGGDELQGFIKKVKLNNSLMSLLGTVKDDEIVKSIILDRYNVEVDVDRSAI